MTTNNRISNIVSSQVPFFVRNDHENFVKFLEAYYEYLEQEGKVVERGKNLTNYFDVDRTIDEFRDKLYDTFLKLIPDETVADKAIILKNAKDLYRAKGTEKSVQFLIRAIFGGDIIEPEFYYPKSDILRASDGKWFIEKSIKIDDIKISGTSNNTSEAAQNFVNKRIVGNTSGASAIIERVDTYYEGSALVRELKLSNQAKDFTSGETIFALFDDGGVTKSVTANILSGIIATVNLLNPGSLYQAGQIIPLVSNTGNGGIVVIDKVTSGNIKSLTIVSGGAGFRVNNQINFVTPIGESGAGARANVLTVNTDESVHPNSYNVISATISLEAGTPIGNATYSNLVSSLADPANNWIANSMTYLTYANTGPISTVLLLSSGAEYSQTPTIDITGENLNPIRQIGILGRLEIANAGTGYANGEYIQFTNVPGGSGQGANANVTVNATGAITSVRFIEGLPFYPIGGSGYSQDYLPTANVITSGGSGANIVVKSILGRGEDITVVSESFGVIQSLRIVSGGLNYKTPPILDLTGLGDGKAQANCTIVDGVYTYPGRYLNDDGFLSGFNYLENRDYYQPFSYVVKTNRSIERYRKYLKDLLHPAGLKLFGEFLSVDDDANNNVTFQSVSDIINKLALATYSANGNGTATFVQITTNRDVSAIGNAYLEYVSVDPLTSNLSILVDPATTVTGNAFTANIVTKVAVGNTSNLEARVSSTTPSKIDFVKFTPVNNTSNLIFNTVAGSGLTNTATLARYVPVNNTSNLHAKVGQGVSNTISLVELNVVNNTSNLVISTGVGSTATLNLNQYTIINQFSNLRVNTGSGGTTNTVSLIRVVAPKNGLAAQTANITVNVGAGALVNTINLVRLETTAKQTNISIRTSASALDATNRVEILRYVPALNVSNLIYTTEYADTTNRITLQRFVSTKTVLVENTSNLFVRTGSGTTTNIGNLVSITLTPNTSNLTANTGNTESGFTNTVILSKWSGNSNVFFGQGYTLNIANVITVVTSAFANSSVIQVSPAVRANLIANSFQAYQISYVNQFRANSNVAIPNSAATIVRIGGRDYTIANSNPASNNINISPALPAGLVANSLQIISYFDATKSNTSNLQIRTRAGVNNETRTISFVEFVPINSFSTLRGSTGNTPTIVDINQFSNLTVNTAYTTNTSNIRFSTGSGESVTRINLTAWSTNSNVTISNGSVFIVDDTLITITSNVTTSNQLIVSPGVRGNIVANTMNIVVRSANTLNLIYHYLSLNTSNLTFSTLAGANGTPNNALVDRIYLSDVAGNSNVTFGVDSYLSVNGANIRIVSTNSNSNVVVVSPFVSGNIVANTLFVYESKYAPANVKDSSVYFSNGYTVVIGSQQLTLVNVDQNSNVIRVTANTITSNLVNARIFVDYHNSNGLSTVINLTRLNAVNNTSNLRVNTVVGVSTNTLTLNRPLASSNVPFANGYLLLIGNTTTVTVTSAVPNSNTITVTPAVSGGLRSNTVRVLNFFTPQTLSNSNVAFGNEYYIALANTNTNQTSNLTFSTGTGTNISTINLSAWTANSNLSITNGSFLRVNNSVVRVTSVVASSNQVGITPGVAGGLVANTIVVFPTTYMNVVSSNQQSDIFTIDRELSTNQANLNIYVSSYYRNQWIGNSNVAFGTNYQLVVNGQNVTTILVSSPTSNDAIVSYPVAANLTNAFFYVDGYYQNRTLAQSNVTIANGHVLNISNNPVRVIDCSPDSSIITFKTDVPGRIIGNSFNVLYYYVPQNLRSSNNTFDNGYRVQIEGGIYVVQESNLDSNIFTISPSLPTDYVSNSIFIQTYYRDEERANSNVAIEFGGRLNIGNSTYIVTGISDDQKQLTITPAISGGNLIANTITVERHFADTWAANSNVAIANGYTIVVDGTQTAIITSVNQSSNTITVTPAITGGLSNVTLNVFSYYRSIGSNNSNVPFKAGYTVNIGNFQTANITSVNNIANTITLDSAVPGLLVNSSLRIVSFYKDEWAANSNVAISVGNLLQVNGVNLRVDSISQNTLTVNTYFFGPVTNGVINVVAGYADQTLNTSNVYFDTGFKINIGGLTSVTITSANQDNSTITFTPALSGSSRNNSIKVESYYKEQWIANSNVAFGNNYVLTVNGSQVIVVNAGKANAFVWPPFSSSEANANVVINHYYVKTWAGNSNNQFAVGDSLRVNGKNVVITSMNASQSSIIFTPSLTGNISNDGFLIYTPLRLSNGLFNVTTSACTNSYYYVVNGISVNANGTLYASV